MFGTREREAKSNAEHAWAGRLVGICSVAAAGETRTVSAELARATSNLIAGARAPSRARPTAGGSGRARAELRRG
eukprot:8932740-Pyramimonas_sp.AAC.1